MKRADRCAKYCGGIIAGMVEKVRRESGEDIQVTITPVKGLTWVPADSYEMTCPLHGRLFIVKEIKP